MIRLLMAPVSRLRGCFSPATGSVILALCCSVSAAVVLNGCNSAATTGRTDGPAESLPLDIDPVGNSVAPADGGGVLSLIGRATPEPTNGVYQTPSDDLEPMVAPAAAPTIVFGTPEAAAVGTQPAEIPTLPATAEPAVDSEHLSISTPTPLPVQAGMPLPTAKATPAQTPSPAPTSTRLPTVMPTPSPVPTSTPRPTATPTPTLSAHQYAAAHGHANTDPECPPVRRGPRPRQRRP